MLNYKAVSYILVLFSFTSVLGENIPPREEIRRIDWVNVPITGGCGGCLSGLSGGPQKKVSVIRNAPNPFSDVCLMRGLVCCFNLATASAEAPPVPVFRRTYSTFFRLNGDDSLIFSGISYGYFSGYRSKETLRNIMSLSPSAFQKLEEFDKLARTGTTLNNIGTYLAIGGGVPLITGLIIGIANPNNPEAGNLAIPLIIGGGGAVIISEVFDTVGEYYNASAFRSLFLGIQLFNSARENKK